MKTNQLNRVESIDIIRGFALLGIFFVNIPTMFYPDIFKEFTYVNVDSFVRLLYDIFIQTKFYTIFSFLFGVSAFYFMRSQERKGLPYKKLFNKRLFWLLLFGMVHLILIWPGDILHTYALIGFFLPLFYNKSVKSIFTWAFIMYLFYFAFTTFSYFLPETDSSLDFFTSFIGNDGSVNFYNNYFGQVQERLSLLLILLPVEVLGILEILPLFLVGFGLAKLEFFENVQLYRSKIIKTSIVSFILTIPFIIFMVLEYLQGSAANLYYVYISGKTLAIVYVSLFLLLVENEKFKLKLSPLASYGKMAFTNYLTQSIFTLCIVSLFINDTGSISLVTQLLYSIVFLSIQVYVSSLLMKNRKYGPFEYLWRILIFGKNKAGSYKKEELKG